MWIKMLFFVPKMARDCTDIDVVLRQINQRLRKLEKSDSEKNEEIGRLNRVINQKDVEIRKRPKMSQHPYLRAFCKARKIHF